MVQGFYPLKIKTAQFPGGFMGDELLLNFGGKFQR